MRVEKEETWHRILTLEPKTPVTSNCRIPSIDPGLNNSPVRTGMKRGGKGRKVRGLDLP